MREAIRMYVVIGLGLVVVVFLLGLWLRSRPMPPERFLLVVIDRIKKDHPELTIKSVDGFEIKVAIDGREHTAYLDNTYQGYCTDIKDLDSIIENFLASIGSVDDTDDISWEAARSRVLPALKPLGYLEELDRLTRAEGKDVRLVAYDYRDDIRIT